jgi:hypothetical protein
VDIELHRQAFDDEVFGGKIAGQLDPVLGLSARDRPAGHLRSHLRPARPAFSAASAAFHSIRNDQDANT